MLDVQISLSNGYLIQAKCDKEEDIAIFLSAVRCNQFVKVNNYFKLDNIMHVASQAIASVSTASMNEKVLLS